MGTNNVSCLRFYLLSFALTFAAAAALAAPVRAAPSDGVDGSAVTATPTVREVNIAAVRRPDDTKPEVIDSEFGVFPVSALRNGAGAPIDSKTGLELPGFSSGG